MEPTRRLRASVLTFKLCILSSIWHQDLHFPSDVSYPKKEPRMNTKYQKCKGWLKNQFPALPVLRSTQTVLPREKRCATATFRLRHTISQMENLQFLPKSYWFWILFLRYIFRSGCRATREYNTILFDKHITRRDLCFSSEWS